MHRFLIAFSICLLLCISCGANQSQRAGSVGSSASHLDVDINGGCLVVDTDKNNVRLLSKDLAVVSEIGGSGWDNNQFDRPMGVWGRNGIDVFVADYGNHRIQRFDRKLAYISTFSTRERSNPDERFGYPTDVAVSRLGDLFICDSENSRILKVVGLSNVAKTFGGFDAGKGRLKKPGQIEIGPNDNVYVQDDRRVVEFDNFGNYVREFGEGMFEHIPLLYAGEKGLTVLSGTMLYGFDENDRLIKTVGLDSLVQEKSIRAFAVTQGTLYLLTTNGVMKIPDPQ